MNWQDVTGKRAQPSPTGKRWVSSAPAIRRSVKANKTTLSLKEGYGFRAAIKATRGDNRMVVWAPGNQ